MGRAAERIDARLEKIEACCTELEGAAERPLSEWLAAPDAVAATERRLEVAIQAAIAVSAEVIAARGWRTPEAYRDTFAELQERGVLTGEVARELQMAAGLRNILAHDYLDVDPARLHGDLASAAAVLRAFVTAISAALAPAANP